MDGRKLVDVKGSEKELAMTKAGIGVPFWVVSSGRKVQSFQNARRWRELQHREGTRAKPLGRLIYPARKTSLSEHTISSPVHPNKYNPHSDNNHSIFNELHIIHASSPPPL